MIHLNERSIHLLTEKSNAGFFTLAAAVPASRAVQSARFRYKMKIRLKPTKHKHSINDQMPNTGYELHNFTGA